jgi:adenosylcobinamide-phosphate synthase
VETVAENTSDGIVAPLFYMACFGAAGGFFYKAVNTMDSMVGYRNERYRDFGRAAARLDDALNLLPARLTGLLMILSAAFCGEDAAGARRIFFRDRLKHDSPNSAHPEAAMAGALGVQLAGDAWYFGARHRKPVIGDDTRPVETGDIARAHRLMIGSECLAVLLFTALRAVWLAWLFRLRLPL